MTYRAADGPSKHYSLSVTTGTALEVKKTSESVLEDRVIVTFQPLDGDIYLYFGNGVDVPSEATIQSDGLIIIRKAKETYEAGARQPLYILAKDSTTKVVIVERA